MSVALLLSTPDTAPGRTTPAKDRFVAFAFAAADLLVEAGKDGMILFAAGAFRSRFGRDAGVFVGQRLTDLVDSADQIAMGLALSALMMRGRIPPIVIRLADRGRTTVTMSAMRMAGPPVRLCFTFGPVPVPAPDPSQGGGRQGLLHAAEQRMRSLDGGEIGLLEIQDWAAARDDLSQEEQDQLRREIEGTLSAAQPGAVAGELADGRFGVVGSGTFDTESLARQVEQVLRAAGAGAATRVACVGVRLETGALAPNQAARALRYALGRFVEGGTEAAAAATGPGGLADLINGASTRARAMARQVAERRFKLQFQPVVSMAARTVHHYEALLRPAPQPGMPTQTTQDFVTFAEAVGLAQELDAGVLEQAVAVLPGAVAGVAVNISGLSMQSPRFRDILLAHAATVPRGSLLVELTETAEIEDMTEAARTVEKLREAGVAVCLDDFGAGAAGFRYLRDLGIDFVKIDGAYVRGAVGSRRQRDFVAAMVELATGAGAQLIAEMIETEEQARMMAQLGVQFGQGWLFGRPGSLPGGRR